MPSPPWKGELVMGGAITSEIRKIFTTRLWWGMALGMAALDIGGCGALVGSDFGEGPDGDAGNPFRDEHPLAISSTTPSWSRTSTLFPWPWSVLLITSEYRHKTISDVPRHRTPLVVLVCLAIAVWSSAPCMWWSTRSPASATRPGADRGQARRHAAQRARSLEVPQRQGCWPSSCGRCWAKLLLFCSQVAAVLIAVGVSFIAHIALNIIFSIQEWYDAAKWLPGNLTWRHARCRRPSRRREPTGAFFPPDRGS